MAYRNPAFLARHLAAEFGAAAIATDATEAGQGKERLIDYALAANMKFSASAANHIVEVDMGAAGETVSRLVIPPGHNLSGAAYEVRSGASSPAATTRASGTFGAGLIDVSWAEVSARYWRLLITTTGQWEFGELWFGRYRQTTTGIVQGWKAPWHSPVVRREFPSREAMLVEAPARRRWELEHVALSGTDLAIYDEVLVRGVGTPFWFYPPDDAVTGPLLMLLEDDGDREQDHPVPTAGPTYTAELAMREQTS